MLDNMLGTGAGPGGISTVGCSIGFTGAVYDQATGMVLMRNRWYDPHLGRFITRDPAGYIDGMSLYWYATGNPVMLVDPMGLAKTWLGGAVEAVGGYVGMKVNSSVFGGTSQARAVATATSSVIPAAIDNGADAFRDALPVASHNSAGMQALDHVIESAERTGQRYQKSIELGIRDGSSPIADRIMLGAQEATGATKIAEGMAKYDASQDRNLTDGEAGLKLLEGGVQMGATAVTLAAPVLPAGGGMVNLADDVIDVAGGTATSSKLPNGQFRSVAFETKLERGSYPGVTRGRHNQEANANLLRSMESDPSLASSMNSLGIEMHRTKTGKLPHMPPAGWTWHHDVTPGTMQLIPRTQHTPGSIFWDGMHPGGRRGYAMWGTCR